LLFSFIEATVNVPYGEENYSPSSESQIQCILVNETFKGWYKADTLIQNYKSKDDIPAGKLGTVCMDGGGVGEKYCFLVLPAGSQSTVGGDYDCKGETNKDTVRVVVKCKYVSTSCKSRNNLMFRLLRLKD